MYLSEYKHETLHNRPLQDKEMTVRLWLWSKWTCVPAEQSSPVVFIIFIIYIFKRDFNYIHYIQCLHLLKQIYVRFLTNYVRFVPLLL